MEKRILLEKRGRSDDEITELILDNCRSTYIDGLTDSFTALETLSLINVGLVSLKNFPKLSNLRKLELSDNRISNGLSHLMGSPKLTHLNLSGNRIKDFDELQPLKDLENLEVLDLFNNQVTLIENYREKLFQLIPSLNYLDGFDKEYVEAPSDEEDMAEEEEAEDSCEESDDVSLAYLYNDNLEEDQEDWKSVESDYNNADEEFDSEDEEEEDGAENNAEGEEDGGADSEEEGEDEEDGGEEEEDDDADDADEEGNENGAEAVAAPAASVTAEATTEGAKSATAEGEAVATSAGGDEGEAVTKAGEPEARGTKRKFQGTDSDG
ncbi:acidic leucine-rich nuclear phosphoprotein 32 family member A isoform X3 [Anopheles stephensi]|uniref:acidic leucine-rich nuclear phosphoprotein 32 family member A isoform X3 n=1 Tax=Anopheles stephensi TaxID=30069 RepID=UPI00165891AB|nr:acidic leucine-rich nuclear phosphoprotein 32 family member A isoform X3 [Anopheles stephensi]XP_035906724.1 acidic leucine-rich nuclear phosphoprotein 32 family member A isoform X3 [Anopheles stephensi]XP_035906725.1 acidic leucine-rich nuclear phosphoprotein 32 family member A isoform X3 [Anopheles stephensi]XP_035906726.1 acidic leucine-rich nuclear phosphoprotein 32 family member A isoform X3 [Anopheles stephensi]